MAQIALHPWDDARMTTDLLRLVTVLPREPLSTIKPPDQPGMYIQFLASEGTDLEQAYGHIVATGQAAFYAGSARSLKERMNRYRTALSRMRDLGEDDLWILVLPCASLASAVFAEQAVIARVAPVMNGIQGWGGRDPGRKRAVQQRVSAACCLIPQWWSRQPSALQVTRARLKVAAHLAQMPDQPLWPALPNRHAAPVSALGKGQCGLRLVNSGRPSRPTGRRSRHGRTGSS